MTKHYAALKFQKINPLVIFKIKCGICMAIVGLGGGRGIGWSRK